MIAHLDPVVEILRGRQMTSAEIIADVTPDGIWPGNYFETPFKVNVIRLGQWLRRDHRFEVARWDRDGRAFWTLREEPCLFVDELLPAFEFIKANGPSESVRMAWGMIPEYSGISTGTLANMLRRDPRFFLLPKKREGLRQWQVH